MPDFSYKMIVFYVTDLRAFNLEFLHTRNTKFLKTYFEILLRQISMAKCGFAESPGPFLQRFVTFTVDDVTAIVPCPASVNSPTLFSHGCIYIKYIIWLIVWLSDLHLLTMADLSSFVRSFTRFNIPRFKVKCEAKVQPQENIRFMIVFLLAPLPCKEVTNFGSPGVLWKSGICFDSSQQLQIYQRNSLGFPSDTHSYSSAQICLGISRMLPFVCAFLIFVFFSLHRWSCRMISQPKQQNSKGWQVGASHHVASRGHHRTLSKWFCVENTVFINPTQNYYVCVCAEQIKELNQELMKHEEQLREVKKNNTLLEKKLEHERCVKSSLIFPNTWIHFFFQWELHFLNTNFVPLLKLYVIICYSLSYPHRATASLLLYTSFSVLWVKLILFSSN